MHVCAECGQGYERAGYCAADGHPLDDAKDPLIGTEVLRYRLARLVGRGGMGNVYLGVQPAIGSRVAVKILSQDCAREPELVERFFAEARAVNLIRHENIVSVIDMAKLPDGRPFIVMEFIEGQTLSKVIKNGRAPLGGIVQVFSDVLSALDAAHAIGIVHRDLKPDNILITGKGHAKVLDFGIAKLAPALHGSPDRAPRTETGALLGTPAYMSPEQISGSQGIDGRSDVYGVGVALFEAVTGHVPFAGATLFDMMRAQLEDLPPSPCAWRSDLPAAMEAVILTALAKRPDMRFQSAAAMANALEQASLELPQEQWRELSTRKAPLSTRGSAPRVRPSSTTSPPPQTLVRRDTPPALSAVNAPKTAPEKSRRPIVIAIAGMAIAGVAGAIIATAATRSDEARVDERGSDPPKQEATTPPVPVQPPSVQPPPVQPPPVQASGDDPVKHRSAVEQPLPASKTTRQRQVPLQQPQPKSQQQAPIAPPVQPQVDARPKSEQEKRAAIADEFKMRADHVALPGEVPIKRRPRMSRGKYDSTKFDYQAFIPQATKLARAELADAKLMDFQIYGVAPDGRANISRVQTVGAEYRFITRTPVDEGCVVVVEVWPENVQTYVKDVVFCDQQQGVPMPKCSLSMVWEKARATGITSEVASLSYNRNGWIFSAADLTKSYDDDCP